MLEQILSSLGEGRIIPYLGPGVLGLADTPSDLPASPLALVGHLTARASVPHKIRNNLTAAAQFIENFKHRKTVTAAMTEAFRSDAPPTALHRYLASLPGLPLLVHAWYDDLPQKALAGRRDWGSVQGVSQAEHFGQWVHYFDADGAKTAGSTAETLPDDWQTLLYQPFGSIGPAGNFLVSDSDFVEVLTEIDIQTPIPQPVQELRRGRNFLFLGCRFANQLERSFAGQIMKRSSDLHWAVLPEEPTRNEARFMERQNIRRLDMPLADFMTAMVH
ncbi:SIR2 family NAD-dependent protein deacylase [Telmatospirillum siberiense]|uniref:SIR2 family protein n=1 Tax=Telmatospirillum siberiense TaxID=382514 RepID=A0A2N3PW04_9PROT|nr:SIR2 family protein [Telmatospirillum siberiense]PKU24567.1 SIR2 family protein [Telmatospirillum siberiense]